ncbi:DUF6479 family protein [Streptomyces chromofuscus]|uniref:Secreted protein n=1 Tax=Streptomyces chromofuscus TaxID=42881 RepID=A0A7M2T8L4_STRCW|nr:DUF6479 family protein [Streptomyces chromofuscus]QOV45047.1 hypothetical protein IPT68_03385 [Streptomyces chromofuscus]GGT28097.1 hypothetical protein GCM10010254_55950 [Streptomyces chromofuscus]
MNIASMQLAAPSGLLALALFVVAIAVVAMLAGSFWLGNRIKLNEPPRPRPDEQPHLPPEGPVHEVRQNREPDEVPRTPKGGRPLTPYELTNMRTRPSASKDRPRWSKGTTGSFGGGGLGAH